MANVSSFLLQATVMGYILIQMVMVENIGPPRRMTVTAAMPHIASTLAMASRTCGITPSDTTACPFVLSRNKSRDVFQDTK